MRYSNTAITELSKKYRKVLLKCALLNAALLLSVPAMAVTVPSTGETITTPTITDGLISMDLGTGTMDVAGDVTISNDNGTYVSTRNYGYVGVYAEKTGSEINIGTAGTTDNITITSATGDAVIANEGATISIQANDTITVNAADGYGVFSRGYNNNSTVNLTAKNVDINGNIWVQSGTTDAPEPYSSVNVTAENINIKQGIYAYSQGIVNLEGNITVSAGEGAISVRGNSAVNINANATGYTTKIDGDIIHSQSSNAGDVLNATVNLNLSGADSYWKGNVFQDVAKTPIQDDLLDINDGVNLTLSDGATWTPTAKSSTATDAITQLTVPSVTLDGGKISVEDSSATAMIDSLTVSSGSISNTNGGTIDVATMDVTGELTLDGTVEADTVTFGSESTLNVTVDGTQKIIADNITIEDGAVANLTFKDGVAPDNYDFMSGSEPIEGTFEIADNGLYNIEQNEDGTISVSQKSDEEISEDLGASSADTNMLMALISADGNGTETGNIIAAALSEALQNGNGDKAIQAAKEIAPTDSQAVLGVETEKLNMIADIANARMARQGRNGGDVLSGSGLWVQGLYNHTKQDRTSTSTGFKANSRGLALGVDKAITDTITVGVGYGYTDTDADSSTRDIEVDGHNVFVYGEYQPSKWYINGIFNYGFAKYKETKDALGTSLKGKYDVNTYGAQVMTGYDFANGITPEAGLRYVLVDADSYSDGVQNIKTDNNDVLTAVAGVKYTPTYYNCNWKFQPKARVAVTYDLISDGSSANVSVYGGGTYRVDGQRLHRLGVEGSLGVTSSYKNIDLTLEYNGNLRQDYSSQGGIVRLKYNF